MGGYQVIGAGVCVCVCVMGLLSCGKETGCGSVIVLSRGLCGVLLKGCRYCGLGNVLL